MSAIAEEAYQHVLVLAEEIGERPMGTPANHQAEAYIRGQLQKAGLELSFQKFYCPDWKEISAALQLGEQSLEVFANTYSPACDLRAETIAACSMEELEAAELRGKILVLYGALVQWTIGARGAIYCSERDRRILAILEERQPAALITVNPQRFGRWRVIEDFEFKFPSATITYPSSLKLLEKLGEPVHLTIQSTTRPSYSGNVIGTQTGRRPQRIIVCAHYDSKVDTPGAYDNAAGVAVLLAAARLLARQQWELTLEFMAISGEEIYGLGDMTYFAQKRETFEDILAVINVDGVGPRLGSNTIATFAANPEFESLVYQVKQKYPGITRVDPWPASDHYIFYSNGVPSVALSSLAISDMLHTPQDTPAWIHPAKLEEVVSLVLELVEQLASKPKGWGRP